MSTTEEDWRIKVYEVWRYAEVDFTYTGVYKNTEKREWEKKKSPGS
jgi:hypothetical protein